MTAYAPQHQPPPSPDRRSDPVLSKPRFDATISLGSCVLGLMGMCVVPFLTWIVRSNDTLDNRITVLESAMQSTAAKIDAADRRSAEVSLDMRIGIRRIDDKLSDIVMGGFVTPRSKQERSNDP